MTSSVAQSVRGFFEQALVERGDTAPFSDADPLFSGGRLDSMAVIKLVLFLEESFGVNFGGDDFDVTRMDSVDQIAALVAAAAPK